MKIATRTMLILTFLLSQFSYASDTHRGGNGGNSIAGHFTTIATNVAYAWEDICINRRYFANCDYLESYKDLLKKSSHRFVTVKSEKKVVAHDDIEREAVNDGKSSITVSETKWLAMNEAPNKDMRRIKLVMHEFFTIINLDASDFYEASNNVLSEISRSGYRLERIAKDELLPRKCSINIKGDYYSYIDDTTRIYLTRKNYEVANPGEITRYTLELKSECEDIRLNSCTLKARMIDNLKTQRPKWEELYNQGLFRRTNNLLFKLLYQYQEQNITTCS